MRYSIKYIESKHKINVDKDVDKIIIIESGKKYTYIKGNDNRFERVLYKGSILDYLDFYVGYIDGDIFSLYDREGNLIDRFNKNIVENMYVGKKYRVIDDIVVFVKDIVFNRGSVYKYSDIVKKVDDGVIVIVNKGDILEYVELNIFRSEKGHDICIDILSVLEEI